MHDRAHRRLDGFQIETARLATVIEDHAQQLIYFARDFLADRFGRCFSWADSGGSSTGRNRQISSLTSSNWPPSSRNRWYSATSLCALANAAGEEKVSVTVLPSTFRVNRL